MDDKYSWVDVGSSYLPSDIQAAYLWGQLDNCNLINETRLKIWNAYKAGLEGLMEAGKLRLPTIPVDCEHNGHMFYIKVCDLDTRAALLAHLKSEGVGAVFHYVPLHSALAGEKFSRFAGVDRFTTAESESLIRLPVWYGLSDQQIQTVIAAVKSFYGTL